MSEPEYLTVGEFTRAMEALHEQVAHGFETTHKKQDETNGRVTRAEHTLAIYNAAKLIEKTDSHEHRLSTIETRGDVMSGIKKFWWGAMAALGVGILSGITVKALTWLWAI